MHLTITTLSDQLFNIEVSEELELDNFKALCEVETGVPAQEMAIVWNGRPLHDNKLSLKEYGIKNGDMVLIQQMRGPVQQSAGSGRPGAGINYFRFEKQIKIRSDKLFFCEFSPCSKLTLLVPVSRYIGPRHVSSSLSIVS